MTKIINTTIEILDKVYPIRCSESELSSLEQAAKFLNEKMIEVKGSGKVINLERIAILTALILADLCLKQEKENNGFMDKVNQRIGQMHSKIESAFNKALQTELIYTAE